MYVFKKNMCVDCERVMHTSYWFCFAGESWATHGLILFGGQVNIWLVDTNLWLLRSSIGQIFSEAFETKSLAKRRRVFLLGEAATFPCTPAPLELCTWDMGQMGMCLIHSNIYLNIYRLSTLCPSCFQTLEIQNQTRLMRLLPSQNLPCSWEK